jgi:hypothetical protein
MKEYSSIKFVKISNWLDWYRVQLRKDFMLPMLPKRQDIDNDLLCEIYELNEIIFISHRWINIDYPDPHGHQQFSIFKALIGSKSLKISKSFKNEVREKINRNTEKLDIGFLFSKEVDKLIGSWSNSGFFYDFFSMPQEPRNQLDISLFNEGLTLIPTLLDKSIKLPNNCKRQHWFLASGDGEQFSQFDKLNSPENLMKRAWLLFELCTFCVTHQYFEPFDFSLDSCKIKFIDGVFPENLSSMPFTTPALISQEIGWVGMHCLGNHKDYSNNELLLDYFRIYNITSTDKEDLDYISKSLIATFSRFEKDKFDRWKNNIVELKGAHGIRQTIIQSFH